MYQIMSEDEYNQRQILESGEDIELLSKRLRELVTAENMDNAMTLDDQKRDFTSYCVEFKTPKDEEVSNVFYAGRKGTKRIAYVVDDSDVEVANIEDLQLLPVFFIGQFQKDKKNKTMETFFAESLKKKQVNSFNDEVLAGKTVYFITKSK